MKTTRIQWLLDELRRGLEVDRTDNAASLKIFRAVLAEALRLGVDSGYVRWLIAITHDERGELEMAWNEIEKCIAADPATPRLYALLVRANAADLGAHLAMVRYRLATGRADEARELARATTKLFPASRETWKLLAEVARAQGDEVTATGAEIEAASAGALEPLFGVFGQAKA